MRACPKLDTCSLPLSRRLFALLSVVQEKGGEDIYPTVYFMPKAIEHELVAIMRK